jgi:hypothetical protein
MVDQLSLRLAPAGQALKTKIDDIVVNGDLLGTKTEIICDDIFETNGFIKQDAKFGSNNGFDGVYIKKDAAGNVQEIIINEAKQIGSAGNIKLNAGNPASGLQAQMSDEWIGDVIGKIKLQGGELEILSDILNTNKNKITKTVTGIDKVTKEVVVLKLANY